MNAKAFNGIGVMRARFIFKASQLATLFRIGFIYGKQYIFISLQIRVKPVHWIMLFNIVLLECFLEIFFFLFLFVLSWVTERTLNETERSLYWSITAG